MSDKNSNGCLTEVPESYWMASTEQTNYPALETDIDTDVAIVGGGITGINAAYLLKKEGMRVVLIEADRIAQGTTGHTTAKITSQHSLIYNKIYKSMGEELAHQYAEANESAIGMFERIIRENNINCDFMRQPAFIYTQLSEYVDKIEDELKTASKLGISAHYADSLPLPFPIKAAMRFDNQAQFHPRKYILALAALIPDKGNHIFENTRIVDLHEGKICSLITANGKKVSAGKVILASHYPFYDRHGLYFTRLYPNRSYLLGVRIREKFPEGMYITAEDDPGRSLRSQPLENGELVLIGGEHHKTGHGGDTMVHYENLRDFAKQTFDIIDIPYRWSAQDYSTPDEVPYVGHLTSERTNIYVATGFAKWGMTNSMASASIIRDLIVKGESPWAKVYNPSRFTPVASAGNFAVETADVAKNLFVGKLSIAPKNIHLRSGEADFVGKDGNRLGAYRDKNDKLHFVGASCSHMGCGLIWNSAEKSWDCPCHGSRFNYEGDIMDGPATKSVKQQVNDTDS